MDSRALLRRQDVYRGGSGLQGGRDLRGGSSSPFVPLRTARWSRSLRADAARASSLLDAQLCIGCGICIKKCPFEAINIINLPSNLASQTTHRYGPNTFKLHRLPTPRPNEVLGLVGTNGIGKSTALKILAGKLKPNLGRFDAPPTWEDILKYFRGSELQGYFTRVRRSSPLPSRSPSTPPVLAVPPSRTIALVRSRDRGVARVFVCSFLHSLLPHFRSLRSPL